MNSSLLWQSIHSSSHADFSRSGGPGGQNVNKVNTKVTLRIKLNEIEGLSAAEAARLRETLASRITGENELIVSSSEERSQRINLERAYARMENLIKTAACLPRVRHPTKPSRAAREKRLKMKHQRGLLKAERRIKPEE
ncbi:MAG: aminoacyl-tRNA hydrolase [Treponema sp.]|nr:aminoacyl-tRNA hydrolase [Treponema sp.]